MTKEEMEELKEPIEFEEIDFVQEHKKIPVTLDLTPQEPTTKNDLGVDAVNRKELLKIYEDRFLELQKLKHLKDNKGAEDRQMGVNYCINILKEMPPVNPQPKTGHWVEAIAEEVKNLSKRVETLENQIKEEQLKKLKELEAEIDYTQPISLGRKRGEE